MADKDENPLERLLSKNNVAPWANRVDGKELISDLTTTIKRYVVLGDEAAHATALWIIASWAYESFSRCPILLINAPERECGKTQLLRVVEMLVKRPLETANISTAALFRIVNNYGPTLLIDEADTFMNEKGELAGIINKGYERGGVVLRVDTVGKELVERAYHVYGPKAMAGITLERYLQEATLSRGIQVPLRRKGREDKIERLRLASPQFMKDLRARIKRFVDDHHLVFAQGWEELPEQLSDRQQDNWSSLLAVAHCLGPEAYEQAVKAAVMIAKETAPPKSSSNQLLEDIRTVLNKYKHRHISSADLVDKLINDTDMDWRHYNRGDPLTQRQLARMLGYYHIHSKTVRIHAGSTPKGYVIRDFDDAFQRYLPSFVDEGELGDESVPAGDELLAGATSNQPAPPPTVFE